MNEAQATAIDLRIKPTQRMRADDFRDLLSSVRDASASLRGCTTSERPNEARILRGVLGALIIARLLKYDGSLEDRRLGIVQQASSLLAAYGAAS